MDAQFERRLLLSMNGQNSSSSSYTSPIQSPIKTSDRYIPLRSSLSASNLHYQINTSLSPHKKSQCSSTTTSPNKKHKNEQTEIGLSTGITGSEPDLAVYKQLLQNTLLNTNIDSILKISDTQNINSDDTKTVTTPKKSSISKENCSIFRYSERQENLSSRMLNKHSSSDMYQQNQNKPHLNQPNMTPTKGVRQLVLNTPEKTEIFRALFREYNEQNFAIRLSSDYNTLRRCHNIKDDKWPQYCINPKYSNATCFETVSNGPNDVCVREVECKQRYLRVACEFTLPGSPEITNSKFQNCPIVRGLRHRLPLWAWILIAVGVAVLLAIIVAIVVFVLKSKKNSSGGKRPPPDSRTKAPKNMGHTIETADPSTERMLNRPPVPNRPTDTGYLQPRKSLPDNNSNA
ncbi:unnamed protein product [Adineta steineri]|uniref:Uncharacterized protein n=1 Tax=Adineta steineri TaxID=433720 RepID=A0A813XC08_9BILA|nr:unnamed protein product [Adineta steineri]